MEEQGRDDIFIIVWQKETGRRFYFVEEEVGLLNPVTHESIREPVGYFSPVLKEARQFAQKWVADIVCSAYSGCIVKSLNSEIGDLYVIES